jgi:hypothetical protein
MEKVSPFMGAVLELYAKNMTPTEIAKELSMKGVRLPQGGEIGPKNVSSLLTALRKQDRLNALVKPYIYNKPGPKPKNVQSITPKKQKSKMVEIPIETSLNESNRKILVGFISEDLFRQLVGAA